MRALPVTRLVLAAVLTAAISGCESAPVSPTAPAAVQTPSTQLRDITLLAPPEPVQIGKTAALRAVATYTDSGFLDVTKNAIWSSTHDACKVSSDGIVTATAAGVAEIVATVGAVKSAPARVTCGFVITITTHESFPTENVIVPAVAGEVLEGPLAGYRFTTDSDGRAVLPPVAAPGSRIHFKRTGFENQFAQVVELPRDTNFRVPLFPEYNARLEFGRTGCAGGSISESFDVSRLGNIRATAELTGGGRLYVSLGFGASEELGAISRSVSLTGMAGATISQSTDAIRTGPGRYFIYIQPECPATTRWRVILEYPQ